MSSIRLHKPNGALFFDFRYQGLRCCEYTLLPDTPANRKKARKDLGENFTGDSESHRLPWRLNS